MDRTDAEDTNKLPSLAPPSAAALLQARGGSNPPPSRPSAPPSSLGSIPPVAYSEPPRASAPSIEPAKRSKAPAYAAIAAGLAVAAGVAIALSPRASALAAGSQPTLSVNVSAQGGRSLDELTVFVDGQKRCSSSPCEVSGLDQGSHFVKVTAPGYQPSADRTIELEGQTELSVELLPRAKPVSKAPAKQPAAEEADDALTLDDLPTLEEEEAGAPSSAPARRRASRAPTTKAPAAEKQPAKSDKAMLSISSNPPANVVVDGRPIGQSPKLVRLSPGTHTVVFVGSEGRRVQTVQVGAGQTKNVAVSF